MKNLLLSTALVLSTATFASAAAHSQIAMQVDNALASMNMKVDVDSLTVEQVQTLYLIVTSESGGDKNADIRAVLNDQNVAFEEEEDTMMMVSMPRSQLRAAVLAESESLGLTDVRIRMLDDEKLSALYLLANGDDSDKMTQAQAIVN